jgi:hemoglobin
MSYDTVDRGKIEKMVYQFYTSVLKDEMLAPIFIKSLGDDLSNGKWHEHLNTLYKFWDLMMTGKRGYGGDPFPPHAFIGPLNRETFERWLQLFQKTVNELFVPEIANKFFTKANKLAEQFIENLGIDDEDD